MRYRPTALCALAIAVFAAGCSDDDKDDTRPVQHDEVVAAICDQYDALVAKCGYDKFDDRAHCVSSWTPCTNAQLNNVEGFYTCLDQCSPGAGGSGGGTSIEDLSDTCAMETLGTTTFDCG